MLPLSAPQVTQGLIYSPGRQTEKIPARVLNRVPAAFFWLGSCRDIACCGANPEKLCPSFQIPSEMDRRVVFSPLPSYLKASSSFLCLSRTV